MQSSSRDTVTSTGEQMVDDGRQHEGLVGWTRPALLEGTSRGEMPWPPRYWLLVVPVIMFLFLAVATIWAAQHVERDIEETAQVLLENAGIDTSTLSFSGDYRDVEVRGILPTNVDASSIATLLEDGRGPDNEDIRLATVTAVSARPDALGVITLEATADGRSLTVSGTVPSQVYKDEILAAAAITGLTITDDNLTVSGLEPASDDADAQIKKFSSTVGGLAVGAFSSAELAIGDEGPVVGTIVATSPEAADLLAAVSGGGVDVSSPAILGALDVSVTYDGTRVVFSGTVFSTEQRIALANAAASVVGSGNVVNNLTVTDLPETIPGSQSRVDALRSVLSSFGGLLAADISLNDTDITVNGLSEDPDGQVAVTQLIEAASSAGLRPGGEIRLASPPPIERTLQEEIDLLQAELDSLQDEIRETVVFAADSAELSDAARATLDKVVAAMNRNPRPVVETGGHTDSSGDDQYNLDLSQRRADAVVAYIVNSDIDEERLRSIGFGESLPLADNETDAGQLQNRRVEFVAKESF